MIVSINISLMSSEEAGLDIREENMNPMLYDMLLYHNEEWKCAMLAIYFFFSFSNEIIYHIPCKMFICLFILDGRLK